jgi:hypothetical protein
VRFETHSPAAGGLGDPADPVRELDPVGRAGLEAIPAACSLLGRARGNRIVILFHPLPGGGAT